MVLCDLPCKTKLIDFYHFTLMFEKRKMVQTVKVETTKNKNQVVLSMSQIIRSFIERCSISEISELIVNETESKLTISSKLHSASNAFQESFSIKNELNEIKSEPVEVKVDHDGLSFLHFITSLEEKAVSSDDLTNSSEGSVSRLPAFEESTYFDGDKFVLRSEVPPKKLKESKKRERKPDFWATNVQKKLRVCGKEYRSAKGYIVEARSMGSPCNCRKDCANKVNEKNRLMNFKSYWNLDETAKKRKFISDHIKLERPMRALKKSRAFSRLILHYLDVINADGSVEQIKVCKKMFLNTFDISNTTVTTTLKLNSQYFNGGHNDGDRS